jgi:hypothetical protein
LCRIRAYEGCGWENLVLQRDGGRDKVIDSASTTVMRRQGTGHPLSFTTERSMDSIDWILVDNDTHTIIRGMLLEGLLQGGGCERSTNKINVDRGKREY